MKMLSPSATPLPPGERKKKKKSLSHRETRKKELVPSPLMGEGQDECENIYLNPSLRGASYATWQSHPLKFL